MKVQPLDACHKKSDEELRVISQESSTNHKTLKQELILMILMKDYFEVK